MSKKNDNRRDFLKQAAIAGSAVTIPYYFSPQSLLASETRSKNDRMPIGLIGCLLYTSPSPRDGLLSRMPSSA